MIPYVILMIVFVLFISLLLFFVSCIFVPAVRRQTGIRDSIIFSKVEHRFEKLRPAEIPPAAQSRAAVLCACEKSFAERASPEPLRGQTCALVNFIYGSVNDCKYSCIGLGDCVRVCPQEAIRIVGGTAVVTALCSGCGLCADACPKRLISMIPAGQRAPLCLGADAELTTCSARGKNAEKYDIGVKKSFKIWQSCYKILSGRDL